MVLIENLERLLEGGQETPLLRFSLGSAYMKKEDPVSAMPHLERALELDPDYSAAWKLYGQVLAALDRTDDARAAYEQGIGVAEAKGDKQASKEMRVFLNRLQE